MQPTNRFVRPLMLLMTVGIIALLTLPFATRGSHAAAAPVTFKPAAIPLGDPEIVAPSRGLFKWNGEESPYIVPLPKPSMDVFRRLIWRDVEPVKDQYNFAKLDAMAAEAQSRGGKFMFKIYDFCTAWCPSVAVPDYFLDRNDPDFLAKGWRYNSAYVPDWNDPRFLARAEKLLNALGQRYGGDPRLGVVEIGIYGNWGEWHTWPLTYPSSTGATKMTADNQRRVIAMHARAFPKKQLVMMRGGSGIADAVNYAMSLTGATNPPVARPVGWAADCWGDPNQENDIPNLAQWPAMQSRWKTAPVMGEICSTLDAGSSNWPVLPQHVATFHISLLGNGNIGGDGKWDGLPTSAKNNYILAGKQAGYRYVLNSLSLPSQLSAGAQFGVTSVWSNAGVAPIYEPWSVRIRLRNQASGQVVWQGQSSLDLRQLLPTGGTPQTVADSFALPAGIPAGKYDVSLAILDTTTSYRAPLPLAIAGRAADGSYRLGAVDVVAGSVLNVPPPPTAVPTAQPTAAPATSKTLTSAIAAGSDDAEENLDGGFVDLGSSDLELTHDPAVGRDQEVGLRFANLAIPKGAAIQQATLTFTAKEAQSEATSLRLRGQASGNASTFGAGAHNLTQRPKTQAAADWSNLPAWSVGGQYASPNLAAVVQEIVNRGDWASGNALVLFVDGSGHRTPFSHDGNAGAAVTLKITYTVPAGAP